MKLDFAILHHQLSLALETSVNWDGYIKHPKTTNAHRSAYFCYQVGCLLDQTICDLSATSLIKKRQICFDEHDKKIPGEWLLDIVWTEDYEPDNNLKCAVPKKVWCAIECESNTSLKNFFIDFAKLVNVKSPIKIFLAGLDQITQKKADDYKQMRLDQAAQYITATKSVLEDTEWYLGFWPSPKITKGKSLWCSLNEYPHLNAIHLYRYIDCKFVLT